MNQPGPASKREAEAESRLVCRNIWKVFGDGAGRLADSVDPSLSREQVLAETGCVLAVRDVSFGVREGETFVIMASRAAASPRSYVVSAG